MFNDSDLELPFSPHEIKVSRYRKKFKAGYTRLLQIKFSSVEHVHWMFQNKRSLGDGQSKIRSDLTKQPIEYRNNVFDELRQRQGAGEANLYIKFIKGMPKILIKEER